MRARRSTDKRFEGWRVGSPWFGAEANVEVAIRIALMYFFIQFVLVMAALSVALVRAQPDVPVWGLARRCTVMGRRGARQKVKTITSQGAEERSPQS
jgi:hypothetical protein